MQHWFKQILSESSPADQVNDVELISFPNQRAAIRFFFDELSIEFNDDSGETEVFLFHDPGDVEDLLRKLSFSVVELYFHD